MGWWEFEFDGSASFFEMPPTLFFHSAPFLHQRGALFCLPGQFVILIFCTVIISWLLQLSYTTDNSIDNNIDNSIDNSIDNTSLCMPG